MFVKRKRFPALSFNCDSDLKADVLSFSLFSGRSGVTWRPAALSLILVTRNTSRQVVFTFRRVATALHLRRDNWPLNSCSNIMGPAAATQCFPCQRVRLIRKVTRGVTATRKTLIRNLSDISKSTALLAISNIPLKLSRKDNCVFQLLVFLFFSALLRSSRNRFYYQTFKSLYKKTIRFAFALKIT